MTAAPKKRQTGLAALGIPLDLAPMEAKLVSELPKDAGWQFEPKWDGFRCLAFRAGDEVEIKAKSGKSLSRFFPEVLENLRPSPPKTFVLDGELVIPVDGALSFDALQMRLHPAAEPDQAAIQGDTGNLHRLRLPAARRRASPCLLEPFEERRAALEEFFEGIGEDAGLTHHALHPRYAQGREVAQRPPGVR